MCVLQDEGPLPDFLMTVEHVTGYEKCPPLVFNGRTVVSCPRSTFCHRCPQIGEDDRPPKTHWMRERHHGGGCPQGLVASGRLWADWLRMVHDRHPDVAEIMIAQLEVGTVEGVQRCRRLVKDA